MVTTARSSTRSLSTLTLGVLRKRTAWLLETWTAERMLIEVVTKTYCNAWSRPCECVRGAGLGQWVEERRT